MQPGDVLLNITGASIGRVCSVPMDFPEGNVNQHVCIIRPRKAHVLPGLLSAYLSTPMMQGEIYIQQTGASREGLTLQSIRNFPVALPPLDEQAAIVRYLDRANDCIRRAISVKERLVKFLTEQRQAVIDRAVTRGLDPDVQLKDSGVEWLGDVPKHWEVRRAKYFYGEIYETSGTGLEELMSVSHKTGVTPRKSTVTMMMAENHTNHKICRPGDIVINTMLAHMVALGVAWQIGIVSPSYGVYRPRGKNVMNPAYINSLLRTETYRVEYLRRSTGIISSRLRLYPDQFLGIPLLFPPPTEQTAIVRYLDKATVGIDTAIDKAQRQIDLLREYRTRLIADVVTGQVDVRGAVGDEVELPVS